MDDGDEQDPWTIIQVLKGELNRQGNDNVMTPKLKIPEH